MISTKSLKIFKKLNGDFDLFLRSYNDKPWLNEAIWRKIEDLIQSLTLINKGLCSPEFKEKINLELRTVCDSEETIEKLKSMIKSD